MGRVYIEIKSGCLTGVTGVLGNDWQLIDWDNIESDPESVWEHWDDETQDFVKANYPEEFEQYFGKLAKQTEKRD